MRLFKTILIVTLFIVDVSFAFSQEKITFPSKDGLTITADLYVVDTHKPYIILLHQAGYSRGEYSEIAPRLTNLGYNCLAIDQRSGYEVNYVKNETALLAKQKGLPTEYLDAMQDIEAAIDFVKTKSDLPIILWGSSYSASLALIETSKNLRIRAVIAFSPGEYFDKEDVQPASSGFVKSQISKLSVPALILSSKDECTMVRELLSDVKPSLITFFCPSDAGLHGSKALWKTNPSSNDYWLAITMFFSHLK